MGILIDTSVEVAIQGGKAGSARTLTILHALRDGSTAGYAIHTIITTAVRNCKRATFLPPRNKLIIAISLDSSRAQKNLFFSSSSHMISEP